MTRRSTAGSTRRNSQTPKRRNAPKAKRIRGVAIAGQVVARLTRERDEALLRETANSEILHLISKSPGDLELVFRTILEHATSICNANFGTLFRFDGENFYPAAQFNTPTALLEAQTRRGPFKPPPGTAMDHVLRTKQVSHSADKAAEPVPTFAAKLAGARSLVAVPMLKDNALIGVIVIYRQEVRPFTDKQIALLKNFASQAVIAIENAQLFNELHESLDHQTATADILRVIAGTPEDSKRALNAIAETAVRMFDANSVNMRRIEGDVLRIIAAAGPMAPKLRDALPDIPLEPTDPSVRCFLDNRQTAIEDRRAALASESGKIARVVRDIRIGSQAFTPLSRQGKAIGVMIVARTEVRPFQQSELDLMTGFADQAVIAIENTRLLNELRQRTADLSESLEQQTATSEVLKVISSSPGELQPVFETLLANAVRLCEAKFGSLLLYEGDWRFRVVALSNAPPALAELRRREPTLEVTPQMGLGRAVATKDIVHIADYAQEAIYKDQRHPAAVPVGDLGGARTFLVVPMLKDEKIVGAIVIYRQQVRPFADKQIELVKNFANQAVIAIENARLLGELRQRTTDLAESLEQQTASAEVLGVISASPGELEPVFQTMLQNATRLCDAKFAALFEFTDGAFRALSNLNTPPALGDFNRELRVWGPHTALGRLAHTRQTVHIEDALADRAYQEDADRKAAVQLGGIRTLLAVPMLKENVLVGAITIFRQEVRPFTDKQIALVTNFAAQAVIAIENTRLLNELRERTEEVVKLNQQLEQRVADQVSEIERMGRLRRFLPPQVADLIVTSGTEKQLESHRREITALFCDLRGFTGFSESSDPEDVMALLRDYHAAIGEIIFKYGGTLERFAGDGVMVIFNDPVPVENPALQAVLMALSMRTAIGAMIEKWRDLGHDLGFGIGIAHGFATLGTIGFEGRFDYAAIGTVSNVASRLCDEAKPGQILISPRVRQAIDKAVTVEPVGEFALKGIRRPIAAYNVLASSSSKPN